MMMKEMTLNAKSGSAGDCGEYGHAEGVCGNAQCCPSALASRSALAAAMRKDALEVFDGPECPQQVRDAIEYCYSLLLAAAEKDAAS